MPRNPIFHIRDSPVFDADRAYRFHADRVPAYANFLQQRLEDDQVRGKSSRLFSAAHKIGGGGGGSSSLTKEGTVFLQNYLRAEEQLSAYASELFQEIFTGQKTPLKNLD